MPIRRITYRLVLDLVAASLLLLGLAYYWSGNGVHEIIGTAMFVLLIAHNTFNRRWYRQFGKAQEARQTLDKALVACLLTAVGLLLGTSVMISNTLALPLPLPDAFDARRVHSLAAYWLLVLVAIHIGIRWRVVLASFDNAPGTDHRVRSTILRVAAAGAAMAGVYSSFKMGIGDKLLSRVSMQWWDFSESTWGFFAHHVAIASLYAFLAHQFFRRR